MNLPANYLNSTKELFRYYKQLGEGVFEQLTEAELFWQYSETNNSIAIIVNHLWGNMLSRWTNFLTEDGEKEWRKRDLEFEDVIKTKAQLTERWEAGWACLFEALDSVNEENFETTIYIRNMGHTVMNGRASPFHAENQRIITSRNLHNPSGKTVFQKNIYNNMKMSK